MKSLSVNIGRFKYFVDMFTMADLEIIYIKKNEIDYARKNISEDRAVELYRDFVDELYKDIPLEHRDYVFIYNIIASEAKTEYKMQHKCKYCEKESISIFEVKTNTDYCQYDIGYSGISILFDYITDINMDMYDLEQYIYGIRMNEHDIKWELLSDLTKESILSYIPLEIIPELFEDLYICRSTIKMPTVKCCDKSDLPTGNHTIFGGFEMFNILINPRNLANIYQINHQLMSRGISLSDQSKMKPFEKNIYVNMIIKKEKEELEKYESNRISRHKN